MSTNRSIEEILKKAKNKGIEGNTRYSSLEKNQESISISNDLHLELSKEKEIDEKLDCEVNDKHSEIASPDDHLEKEGILDVGLKKSTVVETAIGNPAIATSAIAKRTTTHDTCEMFYLVLDDVSRFSTDEGKIARYLLKMTEFGMKKDVLIRRSDFIEGRGVNLRTLTHSLSALEEAGFFNKTIKKEKNIKFTHYSLNFKYFKKFERIEGRQGEVSVH